MSAADAGPPVRHQPRCSGPGAGQDPAAPQRPHRRHRRPVGRGTGTESRGRREDRAGHVRPREGRPRQLRRRDRRGHTRRGLKGAGVSNDSDSYIYPPTGEHLTRVTTILDATHGKQRFLVPWSARLAAECAVDNLDTSGGRAERPGNSRVQQGKRAAGGRRPRQGPRRASPRPQARRRLARAQHGRGPDLVAGVPGRARRGPRAAGPARAPRRAGLRR